MTLKGNNLKIKLGLVFLSNLHSNQLQMPNITLIQKRDAIHLLKSIHKSWKLFFFSFSGKLCNLRQQCHNCALSTWIYTHQQMSNQNSNGGCLGYVAFECHANFHINWESFAHRDQHKTCLGYVAPIPRRWQMSSFLVCESIPL